MKRSSTLSAEEVSDPKKVCLISDNLITMNNLPRSMFHLGGDHFASISCFVGQTRVHVRKYTTNESGVLHPTKDGVSLSPTVWKALHWQLDTFCTFEATENVLVVKKDVCVSKQFVNGELFVTLQRLFLKKNNAFQFVPECVLLTIDQVRKLISYGDVILKTVKEKLLSYTMDYFVQKELSLSPDTASEYKGDPDRPEGLQDLTDSLCVSFKNCISAKITELFECFGCRVGYDNQLGHECITSSPSDKCELYFEKALFSLDWLALAKHFVRENAQNIHFNTLVICHDFFHVVDPDYVFQTTQNLICQ